MGQNWSSRGKRNRGKPLADQAGLTFIFAGTRAAGRTMLLHRLKTGEFPVDVAPTTTTGIDLVKLDKLPHMLDKGGRCAARPLFKFYRQHSFGLAFVCDAGDASRLDDAVEKLAHYAAHLEGVPIAVLCNKCDLLGDRQAAAVADVQGKLETDERLALAMCNRPYSIFAVSAVTGEGLSEALTWLVQAALSLPRQVPDLVSLEQLGNSQPGEAVPRSATAARGWIGWLYRSMKSTLTK